MVYACNNCHFVFSRVLELEQCPDCGKYSVRPAMEEERQEFEKNLAESKRQPL